ncbi:ribonuclease [Neisseriaceae bacterium TC5R-5]|nr:ribonuclease [Neisseriaceae bacterium TC5R-5]
MKLLTVLLALGSYFSLGYIHAANLPACAVVATQLKQETAASLDQTELAGVLLSLQRSGKLPGQFVTKQQAKVAGWQPGRSLWVIPALKGKSIGGDRFGNYERRLPYGQWQEADLSYNGKKRGAYRLIYSPSKQVYLTVDHYQNFIKVPACQ